MRTFASSLTIVSLAVPLLAPAAECQLLASEPASVSQTADGTTITVTYHRPRARGRTGLFGTRIRWGDTWTPGANFATTLGVSKDVTIEGQQVPKGKYSVWIVVGRPNWEMVLDRDTMLFHTQAPKTRPGQIRFGIAREKKPFMEALTWWVPEVSATGMTLAMQWDTVYVPLRIKVPPSYATRVPADVARRIVGRYRMRLEPMREPAMDSTVAGGGESPAMEVTFTIRHEAAELRGVMDPPLFRTESGYTDWVLLPRNGGWFGLSRMDGGELVEVAPDQMVQFDPEGERAKSFEVRMTNDALLARGTRLP